jgi:hypothetical protein
LAKNGLKGVHHQGDRPDPTHGVEDGEEILGGKEVKIRDFVAKALGPELYLGSGLLSGNVEDFSVALGQIGGDLKEQG